MVPRDGVLTRDSCSIAGNTALLTLDSMSLLLSKQNPTQAGMTLSQQLRDMVGIGTLGADRLHDSNVTPAKTKDQEAVAMGWTIMEINKTRDSAEEAAAFLDKEIAAESKYWEDIVSVKKAGWSVCKVPQERHTLGVRFGFSEGMFRVSTFSLARILLQQANHVDSRSRIQEQWLGADETRRQWLDRSRLWSIGRRVRSPGRHIRKRRQSDWAIYHAIGL